MRFAGYFPHIAQARIHQSRARFRTVCTGRRFGKTLCLAAELMSRGNNDPPSPQGGYGATRPPTPQGGFGATGPSSPQGGCGAAYPVFDYGWVAPTYNVAERGVEACRLIADDVIQICGRAPTRVEFKGLKGKVRIWFLSADNPDNIRGFGFQGLVIDEAASIPQDVWHYVLRPTIAQTLGWAVFVSTPKGRNWFYDLFTRGMDPREKDYASFRFPSKASPFFPAKEWEEAKRTLPADVFRQEYEAEFLEDSAGVFRGVEGCLIPEDATTKGANGAKEERHRSVVIGCDVAKHTDWTVLIAMDAETGRCFAMERFNQLEWPIQKERILGFVRRWRGRLILDASGVGDPIYDELKRVWPDVEGFKFTAHSKVELVQRLIVAVEQRKVSWPAGVAGPGGRGVVGGVGGGGRGMQEPFGAETGPVISPHALCSPGSRGYVSSDSRDAARLGQADGSASASPRQTSGQPNGSCGATHGAGRHDIRGEGPKRATVSAGAESAEGAASDRIDRIDGMGCWDVLTNEMKRYEYQIGASGSITYGAPAGYHDDCVMALALANHRRWECEGAGHLLAVLGDSRRRTSRARRRERCLLG